MAESYYFENILPLPLYDIRAMVNDAMINNPMKPMSNVCNVFQLQFEVCWVTVSRVLHQVYGLYRNTIMRLI